MKININRYCDYFEEQLVEISNIPSILFQKLLIVAMLDTLSHVKCPLDCYNNNSIKVKNRFTRFIRCFSEWKDCDRVSLQQLQLLLIQSNNTENTILVKEIEERFNEWKISGSFTLEKEPMKDELYGFGINNRDEKFINDAIHLNLFYSYRNHLVHEFKEPGFPMEIREEKFAPYYFTMTHPPPYNDIWELVYPIGFFTRISRDCIKNLRNCLLNNNLNPYDFHKFDSTWRQRDKS